MSLPRDVQAELRDRVQLGPGLTLLTGENGSGKSSAARALQASVTGARLLSPESQQAFFEAELANDDSNFSQGVDTSQTIGELLGVSARVHPLVSAFRLSALWERHYRLLSTGEARKVLLLREVLSAPSLLILDDPFDGLDREAQSELARAIVAVARELPVVVALALDAQSLPFPAEEVGEVFVVSRAGLLLRGTGADYVARGSMERRKRPAPPVEQESFCEPVDPNTPIVQLRDGSVRYGERVVFEGLNFELRAGQHTLIEGPNGSGKTSLLEMFTGDHPQAYSNDLRLFGLRRGSGESVWDIKRRVGLVSARLHRDYRVGGSAEEVLISGLYDSIGVYRAIEPSHRARAQVFFSWLELGVPSSTPFRELSFGQQRFLLVARAAIKLPPLLVLDEPTAGLDDENRARVLQLVESLCAQHKSTVLMVTHRADERAFWQAHVGGPILSLGTPG